MNKIIWKQEYLCMLYRRIRPLKDLAVKKKEYKKKKKEEDKRWDFHKATLLYSSRWQQRLWDVRARTLVLGILHLEFR